MANISQSGTYPKEGSFLISDNSRLIIGNRDHNTLTKSLYYMTSKPLLGHGAPVSISNLLIALNSPSVMGLDHGNLGNILLFACSITANN